METPKTSSKRPQPRNPGSKVRVVVRVRPFLQSEILETSGNPISCVSVLESEPSFGNEVTVHLKDRLTSRKECYKLDSFFRDANSASEIFEKEVFPLISWIFQGRNSTVFACGATGSGKTHLMQGTDELPGLMPLSMSAVLKMCERSGNTAEISYYEVYMDKCYDLLEPKVQEISVLDDKDGHVHFRGLSRIPVSTMPEFQQVLSSGIQRRKVAHTGLNDVSSRSHGVLVIAVSSPSRNSSVPVVLGKLNLIDLAGNEDNRRTGNGGIHLQESAKINQSLFSLSNVIHALNNNKPRVPYRESKLTRILQDSLGGNSHSLMIACLNPDEYQESINTVSLASRSRQIKNNISSGQKEETPTVKIDMEAKLRAWLESKGKSQSAQRALAFGSPRPSKTPLSTTRSIKKQSSCQSYAKLKGTTDQRLANARRNLFKSVAPIDSSVETALRESCGSVASENCVSVASKSYAEPISEQECLVLQDLEGYKDFPSIMQVVAAKVTDESCGERVTSPCKHHLNAHHEVEGYKNSVVMQVDDTKVTNDATCGDGVTSPCKDLLNACNEVEGYKNCTGIMQVDDAKVTNDEICGDGVTSPCIDLLNAYNNMKDHKDCISVNLEDVGNVSNDESCGHIVTSRCKDHLNTVNDMGGAVSYQDCFRVTEVDSVKALNDESCGDRISSPCNDHINAFNIIGVKGKDSSEDIAIIDLNASSPYVSLKKDNLTCCTPSTNYVGSPEIGEKNKAFQNSLRKALSPINQNSNIKSYTDSFDPKTPKTPRVQTCDGYGYHGTNTPLDKYNIGSSNLKSSLQQEYLEFLNSASKEELLKLKGIGHKRAEYILHLRETSPLESLHDLEKIGLSSKQVNGMFRRAARGIFD